MSPPYRSSVSPSDKGKIKDARLEMLSISLMQRQTREGGPYFVPIPALKLSGILLPE